MVWHTQKCKNVILLYNISVSIMYCAAQYSIPFVSCAFYKNLALILILYLGIYEFSSFWNFLFFYTPVLFINLDHSLPCMVSLSFPLSYSAGGMLLSFSLFFFIFHFLTLLYSCLSFSYFRCRSPPVYVYLSYVSISSLLFLCISLIPLVSLYLFLSSC
jgi:hypothetical protein